MMQMMVHPRKKAFKSLDKINDITLQPGDKVLLEKGSVFDDQYIHVKKGSGSAEAPIEISTYGEGDRPQINANGKGVWYQDYGNRLDNTWHKYQGNVSSTILLEDVEYIEVRGLERQTTDRKATMTAKHTMTLMSWTEPVWPVWLRTKEPSITSFWMICMYMM